VAATASSLRGSSASTNFRVVGGAVPDVPVPVSPTGDVPAAGGSGGAFVLVWQPIVTAQAYDIRVVNGLGEVVYEQYSAELSVICATGWACMTAIDPLGVGPYTWAVRSRNTCGVSQWAETPFSVVP
jgi:hypothetical protein